MDTHYATKFRNRLLRGLFMAAALAASGGVMAQMSNTNGNYTINSGAAASSTNFRNWLSFSQALQNITRNDGGPLFGGAGISTPIVVDVQSSILESVSVEFPAVTGSSSTNTITINGNGYTVEVNTTSTASASKPVIRFSGGDYFRIRNLTIQNRGTASPWGVHFYNQSDNNLIENCTIQFTNYTSSVTSHGTTAAAYIVFSESTTATNFSGSAYTGQFDTIRSCLMRTTNTSVGPAFGITCLGSTSLYTNTPSNNTFEKNTIQNFNLYAIMDWYTNGDHIVGNDISRVNAGSLLPATTHMGIRMEYMYGQGTGSRGFKVNDNKIHDLPYSNLSTTAGSSSYGIYATQCYGASVNSLAEVEGNEIYNLRTSSIHYGFWGRDNYRISVSKNTIRDCRSSSTSYSYGMYVYYHYDGKTDFNVIKDNRPNSHYYAIYYYYNRGGTLTGNQILDNISQSTSTYNYLYCINAWYNNDIRISQNKLLRNGMNYMGFVYSIYLYYPTNCQMESNLIAKQRVYYYHYGLYGYNYSNGGNNTIDNNTIDLNYNSPYSTTYNLSLYVGGYSTTGPWKIRGNIVTQTSDGFYNYMCYLYGQTTGFAEVDYNVFFCNNSSTNCYFSGVGTGYIGTWPGIINNASQALNTGFAPIGATRNNIFVNPRFNDIANDDYRPRSWRLNNSMPTYVQKDNEDNARNAVVCDRGCREIKTDLEATSVTWNAGATPCSNFDERPTISIKNNFVDTAYNFRVSFRINNGPKTSEIVSTRILSGQSANYTFQAPVRLVPGSANLQVFIDLPDDDKSNDTQKFAMNVRPAPSGGEFTLVEGLNDPRKNLEVTIENQSVKYTFSAPRMYTNSDYGSSNKWTATAFARSVGGRSVNSYVSLSGTPSSSSDGEITFTPTDLNDEDSTFIVGVVINDVANGCDTTIQRRVYVQPLGRPDFKLPAVNCFGDATFFENTSTIKSGALDYIWYFGDGDTSIASSPVHTYAASGTYNVKLVTVTNPYGFTNEITVPVTINDVPAVNFSKVNVCDGGLVRFNNTTSPLTPTTYSWDLGDGTKPTATNPSHTYSAVGTYQVTLTATLNGCAKSITKNMYVFPKPVASYVKAAGTCDNEEFAFTNNSTISSGLLGYYWDFDDNGAVGTLQDETHRFSTPGTHRVKMKAVSEFGCVDSATQNIAVRQAPMADFTNTAACSITPTTFTNTTAPVSGTTPTYTWNFGDGTNSGIMSPVKSWTTLGPKTVTMKVELDNGCADEVAKTLSVGIQPNADFATSDVCAGDQMVFVNNTTWPQGDITYLWNFADGNTSTETAPRYTYSGVTSTRVFNVTLYAFIAGGCADSMTKQVTVNEGPRTCDFDADINYNKGFRGVDFTPKSGTGTGAQSGVNYTWIYDTEGQSNGPAGYNNFQEDGVYRITMRARNANGCECVAVKTVTINRRGVSEANGLDAMVNLYPNPNNGQFTVSIADAVQFSDLRIGLYDILGSKIADVPTAGRSHGNFVVGAENLSSGIYLVRITGGGQTALLRVNIQR